MQEALLVRLLQRDNNHRKILHDLALGERISILSPVNEHLFESESVSRPLTHDYVVTVVSYVVLIDGDDIGVDQRL